jgi:CHAD domain-containing protein
MAVGAALKQAAKPFEGDVKPVHAVRVSTRRAAATLQFFEDEFSKKLAERFRKRLKRIRRAAGVARDADVRLDLLTARGVDSKVVTAIQSEQVSARKDIQKIQRKAQDKRWFKARLRELLRSLERVGNDSLPVWIAQRWDALSQEYLANTVSNPATIETLHRFRIRTKTLRYQLELLADRLPQRAYKQTLGLLIRVQDDLGNLIDQVMLLEVLERLEPAHVHGHQRRSSSSRQLQRSIERTRNAFLKDWAASRERELTKQLRNLVRQMNRASTSR